MLDWLFFGDGGGALLSSKHDPNKGNDNNAITRVGHSHRITHVVQNNWSMQHVAADGNTTAKCSSKAT